MRSKYKNSSQKFKLRVRNNSINDLDPTNALKIQKFKSKIQVESKKVRKKYIESSNPWGNQATHFDGCIESPNADNSCYNCQKIRITYDVRPFICVSFAKEWKIQVRWVTTIGQRAQRWVRIKNCSSQWVPLLCT